MRHSINLPSLSTFQATILCRGSTPTPHPRSHMLHVPSDVFALALCNYTMSFVARVHRKTADYFIALASRLTVVFVLSGLSLRTCMCNQLFLLQTHRILAIFPILVYHGTDPLLSRPCNSCRCICTTTCVLCEVLAVQYPSNSVL